MKTRPSKWRISRRIIWAKAVILLLGWPMWVGAATLDKVDYASLPGGRMQIRLDLSEPPGQLPLSFTIDNPARIAIDFPNTQLNLDSRTKDIGVGVAQSVSTAEASGRTRVVLNLVRLIPYDISMQGSTVVVTLEGSEASIDQALPLAASQPTTRGASIQDIDFRRGERGEGRVLITLSDPSIGIDINEQGGKVLVDFANTSLPETLDRKLDVVDFATPVTQVDTSRKGNGVRMAITPTGHFEHVAYQTDNLLTVEIRPLTRQEQEAMQKAKFGYTGERLSLNFQDIEVRAVLQLIADFTGKNLIASDTVGGTVTLRLKNVPWDQALDIILKSKGLGKREVGNVIMVAPQEEIAAREKLELESQQQIEDLAPLVTEFLQVNYGKAEVFAELIKSEANNLLSERGNLAVDERTNTLIVQDTADKIAQMRNVITTLDIPVRQVLIESRIVVANEDFVRDLGVQFGVSGNTGSLIGDTNAVVGGKQFGETNTTRFPGGTGFVLADDFGGDAEDGFVEGLLVNLPAATPTSALGLAVGKIGTWLLQLELSAMQLEGRGEVISAPRVITANQREAVIEQGTEIPYLESSSSGAATISFRKAVLSLKVIPQITPDDRLILDLDVHRDTVGQIFTLFSSQVPSIDTQNVTTQVLVDNGETVVLGGVFEQENRDDVNRVPFFGELPYVGRLFKQTRFENNKTELIIFVTPKIMKQSLGLR